MQATALERTLTAADHARLTRLLLGSTPRVGFDSDRFDDMLRSAQLVPSRQVSPDIVTMYTQALLASPDGTRKTLTVCYPEDAEPAQGFVSVLSPVGSALLGLRVGEHACWRTPLGDDVSGEVVAILFQPEASGDYTL